MDRAAFERDCRDLAGVRCGAAGEAAETRGRLSRPLGGDPQAGQGSRAVGMIEKAVAPDKRLGVMRQKLHAAFRHAVMGDARDREARILAAGMGCDRPAHIDERQRRETGLGEPTMFGGGISAAEGGEVQPDMIGDPLAQLPRELGIAAGGCDRGQDLDIALPQHRAAIAGAGRDGLAVHPVCLRRERGQAKAAAFESGCRRIHLRHEMRDVVEEHGAWRRQLVRHSRSSR